MARRYALRVAIPDIRIPIDDMLAAPDGQIVLRAKPVVVEPVDQIQRLEIDADPQPLSPDPDVPRRAVTVAR